MDYNTDEQEIDLKDLMFAVFHKWRPVILVAVICGLLLGGVKGYMTYKSQSDPEVRKEADLTYSADLELYEKNKETYEREIENLRTDIINQQDYLDNSIWINMSPYDVGEARVDLYVSTGYEIMPGMTYQPRLYGYDPSGIPVYADKQCGDGGCREEGWHGVQISERACDRDDWNDWYEWKPVQPSSYH